MRRLSRLGVVLGALLAAGSASAQSKDTAVPEAPETPGGVKTPESPEEHEPEGPRPFGASPGSEPAVVDPTLSGMVMKVGPASEDDLKRGYASFVYGYLEMFPRDVQPGGTLKRTHYLSGNLLVSPVRSVTFGAELLFGRRENKDGAGGNAVRLIFSTRFFY